MKMMEQQLIQKAEEIIRKQTAKQSGPGHEPYCVLTLMDAEGYPTSSAITAAQADGLKTLTFCTGLSSNKAERIRKCDRACVCFCREDHNITLVGTIAIVTDPDVLREMWYDGMLHHFSGPEDPQYCVLRFQTKRYSLFVDWQELTGTRE